MLQRVPDAFQPYPLVYDFVFNHVRMQFEDIGAMLRFPMQAYGLNNGCNFASASIICRMKANCSHSVLLPRTGPRA